MTRIVMKLNYPSSVLGLTEKTAEIAKQTLEMCISADTGHVSSCLSCAELLTVPYYGGILRHDPKNPNW